MRNLFLLIILSAFFVACKKQDENLYLRGATYHGDEQTPMSQVRMTVYKQVLQNGIFGGSFSQATSTTSGNTGIYDLSWTRENFAALKLVAEREQYVTREFTLNVGDFEAGEAEILNVAMYPEAFISVRIQNTGQTSSTDRCNFSFVNAIFDCACCSNGWKEFEGANVDTTFACRLYGNRWLKYQRNLDTVESDSVIVDSVWCPAFQTTEVLLQH